MNTSKFSEVQIINILKEYESGCSVLDFCREHVITSPTFYSWKRKYSNMDAQQLKELKATQEENSCLKEMFAD